MGIYKFRNNNLYVVHPRCAHAIDGGVGPSNTSVVFDGPTPPSIRNNTYPRRIRRRSNLGHIFREKEVHLMGREIW
jgi:hypothetical protein